MDYATFISQEEVSQQQRQQRQEATSFYSTDSVSSDSYDCRNLTRHYDPNAHDSALSVATYASTIASDTSNTYDGDDNNNGSSTVSLPPFVHPWIAPAPLNPRDQTAYTIGDMLSEALPATPSDFSALFPSTRKLIVHHDHSSPDGGMNLRADVLIRTPDGETCPMSLYHLRMHDLRTRDFSLRRYARDSGREVCQASAAVKRKPWEKEVAALGRQDGWRGSLGSVIAGFGKSTRKEKRSSPPGRGDGGSDSGYGSFDSDEEECLDGRKSSSVSSSRPAASTVPINKDQISLEFSNYAHVDIKRRGVGKRAENKRYEFEYWGVYYSWQRMKSAEAHDMNYQLINHESNQPVAHIAAIPLTIADAYDEVVRGSWVPPCSLWINDNGIAKGKGDVADVVVATGMMCLVDGWVRKRFDL